MVTSGTGETNPKQISKSNNSPPFMDQSVLIMLTILLHLQDQLDTTCSSISLNPSTTLLTSTSTAHLLLFIIASVLSHLTATHQNPTNNNNQTPPLLQQQFSISAFRAFSSNHIGRLEAPLRDAQWRSLYGLSYPVFRSLVEKIEPYISQSNLSLPSDYAVGMVLSRLSLGLSAKTLASRYSLEPYLISKITNMVTRLLATKLYPEFVKIPSSHKLHQTTRAFEEMTLLPNICGAVDTTAVRVRSKNVSDAFVCKHGFRSVLLQVVSDHKKIFWDVCVKAPGGVDDATHLRDSLLYNRLISGDIVWNKVMNVRGHHSRPYIVGDWCFPLLSFLMTPFSWNRTGSPAQNAFDDALMKGRKNVEEAIGLLKGRWRIMQNLNVDINHAPQTIVACCVLHNMCQIAREPEPELWKEPEENGLAARILENEKSYYYFGESLRQALAEDLYRRLSLR